MMNMLTTRICRAIFRLLVFRVRFSLSESAVSNGGVFVCPTPVDQNVRLNQNLVDSVNMTFGVWQPAGADVRSSMAQGVNERIN